MIVTRDNKWLIIALRNVGMYVVLDIKDKKTQILANSITTLGGETLEISNIENIAYLCDGSKGLAIIDLNFLP